MTLVEIAEVCWKNKHEITYSEAEEWNNKDYLTDWIQNNLDGEYSATDSKSGWYWFELDKPISKLMKLKNKKTFPENIINWPVVAETNSGLFKKNICHNYSKIPIVYNGHCCDVFKRIREHIFLNNDSTGALGIKHYFKKSQGWKISFITMEQIKKLSRLQKNKKEEVLRYCSHSRGREVIEHAWRFIYGWPILCEK